MSSFKESHLEEVADTYQKCIIFVMSLRFLNCILQQLTLTIRSKMRCKQKDKI